ncbi:uncharacterized protein LOC115622621 isoform X2 [Scaptodrosophila lebanonensis]|uniref:Uncharacterized protein LOC115622621 isoform X2 n=1 Tax=Drosophila lebanonensis TaxID=7225 RepID=A0A6J2T8Z9_DROLE|nr:uncharacterized protein LOC115622621 isoform X2 [Scaptodrosophila lebanonensis]
MCNFNPSPEGECIPNSMFKEECQKARGCLSCFVCKPCRYDRLVAESAAQRSRSTESHKNCKCFKEEKFSNMIPPSFLCKDETKPKPKCPRKSSCACPRSKDTCKDSAAGDKKDKAACKCKTEDGPCTPTNCCPRTGQGQGTLDNGFGSAEYIAPGIVEIGYDRPGTMSPIAVTPGYEPEVAALPEMGLPACFQKRPQPICCYQTMPREQIAPIPPQTGQCTTRGNQLAAGLPTRRSPPFDPCTGELCEAPCGATACHQNVRPSNGLRNQSNCPCQMQNQSSKRQRTTGQQPQPQPQAQPQELFNCCENPEKFECFCNALHIPCPRPAVDTSGSMSAPSKRRGEHTRKHKPSLPKSRKSSARMSIASTMQNSRMSLSRRPSAINQKSRPSTRQSTRASRDVRRDTRSARQSQSSLCNSEMEGCNNKGKKHLKYGTSGCPCTDDSTQTCGIDNCDGGQSCAGAGQGPCGQDGGAGNCNSGGAGNCNAGGAGNCNAGGAGNCNSGGAGNCNAGGGGGNACGMAQQDQGGKSCNPCGWYPCYVCSYYPVKCCNGCVHYNSCYWPVCCYGCNPCCPQPEPEPQACPSQNACGQSQSQQQNQGCVSQSQSKCQSGNTSCKGSSRIVAGAIVPYQPKTQEPDEPWTRCQYCSTCNLTGGCNLYRRVCYPPYCYASSQPSTYRRTLTSRRTDID